MLNGNHCGFLQTEPSMFAAFNMVVPVFELEFVSKPITLGSKTAVPYNLTIDILQIICLDSNDRNAQTIGQGNCKVRPVI